LHPLSDFGRIKGVVVGVYLPKVARVDDTAAMDFERDPQILNKPQKRHSSKGVNAC
jgi:hypothetical protein